MNYSRGTPTALIRAGRALFPRHGYDGTSVRALTAKAQANLGAVTYHFGSKEALYHAVITSFVSPLRERITQAAEGPGTPLDRIERVIRAYFDYLAEHPEIPRLMLQQLASGREPPPPVVEMGRHVFRTLAGLFAAGQHQGEIRDGQPSLMAASVVSQPVFFNLVQPVLREVAAIDLRNPATREGVVQHVTAFVRAALAGPKETTR